MAGMQNKRKMADENAPQKRAKIPMGEEVIDLSGDDEGVEDVLSEEPIELDDDLFKQLNQCIDDDEFEFSVEEIMRGDREREEARELEMQRLRERVAALERQLEVPGKRKITEVSCPFCPFTSASSSGFRPLKMHLASGSCKVSVEGMVHAYCTHPSDRFFEGESGISCLQNAGFRNPYDIENEFFRYQCKSCDFKHWHKGKYNTHVAHCRGRNTSAI